MPHYRIALARSIVAEFVVEAPSEDAARQWAYAYPATTSEVILRDSKDLGSSCWVDVQPERKDTA